MLNLIEASLVDKGLKLYRIDGKTSMRQRRAALKAFSDDEDYSIMLASIGAAGEGYACSIIFTHLSQYTLSSRDMSS